MENWAIEAGSPNILMRRGITKDTVKVGTKIVVEGYQSKDGSKRANGRDLTLPDGTKLFLAGRGPGRRTKCSVLASTRRSKGRVERRAAPSERERVLLAFDLLDVQSRASIRSSQSLKGPLASRNRTSAAASSGESFRKLPISFALALFTFSTVPKCSVR